MKIDFYFVLIGFISSSRSSVFRFGDLPISGRRLCFALCNIEAIRDLKPQPKTLRLDSDSETLESDSEYLVFGSFSTFP